MSESLEGIAPKQTERPVLPEISEHSKLVDAAKRKYQSLGSVVTFGSFPKEELDSIYVWWDRYPVTKNRMDRLEAVISSGGLPKLEKKQFKKELEDYRGKIDPVNSQIIVLLQKPKLAASDLRPVVEKIEEAYEGALSRGQVLARRQVLALGEAIVEAAENLDEREVRVRIAQGAWEELLNLFAYARLHYAADTGETVTTQEDSNEQKDEFIAALKRKPWGIRQTEKNRKVYQGIRKTMKANEYDQEILDNFKLVWDTARGVVPEGKSALDVIKANETVLQDLQNEGAFEWDLEELEEEGEGEDEEED